MSDFHADSRFYIDFTKIIILEYIGSDSTDRRISITLLNGKTFSFYEKYETDYKAFHALKNWHEEKIKTIK